MTVRVDVSTSLLAWAIGRARVDRADLARRFPKLEEWLRGERRPTLRQLEHFAQTTHVPIGVLLLEEPPEEFLPLPDFRTFRDEEIAPPSPDLLDTIYLCQQRQDWYREFLRHQGRERLPFVASLDTSAAVEAAASAMRETLDFGLDVRSGLKTWTEALHKLAERAETAGVLVMINGIVRSNTHRKLDPDEFRGFSLVDDMAPVVFVNGADTKAAQIFTLAHELAHVWLGQSGVDNPALAERPDDEVERWCNKVAAELLVPHRSLRERFRLDAQLHDEINRLVRLYKVSSLVVLRSVFDAGFLTWTEYRDAHGRELASLPAPRTGEGGTFYNLVPVRASKEFTRSIISDVLGGRTPYRDALRLLGFSKEETFDELGRRMGVA